VWGEDIFPSTKNSSLKNKNSRSPPDFEAGEASANARTWNSLGIVDF
jgi:hypothetical protein